MNFHRTPYLLILILITVSLSVCAIVITLLYQTSFEQQRSRLLDTVSSQGLMIEAVSRLLAEHSRLDHPDGAVGATLEQVLDAYGDYQTEGGSREFTLARLKDDNIVFLFRSSCMEMSPDSGPFVIPMQGTYAIPMKLALAGKKGTVVDFDYQGNRVLAAYEMVKELDLGIVAKIDLAEIRKPFIFAGLVSVISTMLLVAVGTVFFWRLTNPLIHRLERSEAKLSGIIRTVEEAIISVDESHRITMFNRGAEFIFGYTEKEILGQPLNTLLPPRFHAQHEQLIRQFGTSKVLSRGMNNSRPVVGLRKNGEEFYADAGMSVLRMNDEVIFTVAMHDITEQRRVEEILRQNEKAAQLLKSIAVAASNASTIDEALQVAIDSICEFTGWPVGHAYIIAEDSAAGLMPTALWHLDDPTRYDEFRKVSEQTRFAPGEGLPGRVMSTRQPLWIADVSQDMTFVRASLAEDVGVRGAFGFPLRFGDEVVAVLEFFTPDMKPPDEVLLDLMYQVGVQLGTLIQRKRSEGDREAIIAELEDRQAELERFTYTVSHDLRSPLITILGFLGLIKQDVRGGNIRKVEGDMERITQAVKKMQGLLDDLLDLSRIGRMMSKPEDLAFQDIAQEAVELVAGRLAERRVEVKIDSGLPSVHADRSRLREVVQNLLENAIKYMGDQDEPLIEIGIQYPNDTPIFFVKDNGIGIDARYHEKIFDLFDQLDQTASGTGIGLAIVKRIIEFHNGRIWVESAGMNQGSTFFFTLPTIGECLVQSPEGSVQVG